MSVNDPMMESKHHDPMLDGIIRFGLRGLPGYPTDDVVVVVPFSDLPALLAAAREDERGKTIVSYDLMKQRKGYEQGQRDEREACIALVETVAQSGAYIDYVEIDSVIAAIRARSDGGES